ncbi:hypothetical protein ACVWXN_009383 [Bradyrhizobium sp. i1.4.4]
MRPHFRARISGSTACVHRKRRFQVDHHGAVEILFGEIVDAARDRDAGIIDEDIDRPEPGRGALDHCSHGVALRDVGGNDNRATALLADLACQLLGLPDLLPAVDRHRRA